MEKAALLTSERVAFDVSLTRTRHCVDDMFGVVHVHVFALRPMTIVFHELPLSELYSTFTIVPVGLVHVIAYCATPVQLSPPFGLVTVIDAEDDNMVNVVLLTSYVALLDGSLTRTIHCVDAIDGTVQVYVPALAAVEALIVVQFVPLLVEYSIFTFVTLLLDQVTACWEPNTQFSPPLGLVTVIDADEEMVNVPLTALTVASAASLILTLHDVDGVFGTVHSYDPALASVEAMIVVQFAPLLVEYSSFTLVMPLLVQLM
jgi:hypothetical protein